MDGSRWAEMRSCSSTKSPSSPPRGCSEQEILPQPAFGPGGDKHGEREGKEEPTCIHGELG